MPAGSSQLLAWNLGGGANTAVHGGGSCQISITYETDPEEVKKPSAWKVIYSIEGGCPSNTYQNLDGSYQGPSGSYSGALPCSDPKTNGVDCVNSFNFTIPKGVKSGDATLSWSWFNTVGNRELYQDCASVHLTGGDGSEMSEFPSMFVANMASVNQCPTTQSVNLEFPYPGKYVTTKTPSGEAAHTASTFPMAKPTGADCASNGAPAGGAGAPPKPSPHGHGAPSSVMSQPTTASSSGGGLTTMVTLSNAAPTASAAPPSSAPPAPPASSQAPPAPAPSSAGTSPGSGSCANGKVSCSNVGGVICIGSTKFGLCDVDNCAVPQAVAPGTTCSGGLIARRSHVRHARRHVGDSPLF